MAKSKKNFKKYKKLNRDKVKHITKKYGGNRFTRRIRDLFKRKKPQKIERIVRKGWDDWESSAFFLYSKKFCLSNSASIFR